MKKKKFNKYTASRLILGVLAFFMVVFLMLVIIG